MVVIGFQAHYSLNSSEIRNRSSHSDQIVGCQTELEHPSHTALAPVACLSLAAHRLQPAKDFFDPRAASQTNVIALVSCGATVNRTVSPFRVLSHVRRHINLAQDRKSVV